MESALVNARITRAKKEAAVHVLEQLGSTTSELINSAFDYVIACKKLPVAEMPSAQEAESFETFVAKSTLAVDWGNDGDSIDYKALVRAGRQADYESLA